LSPQNESLEKDAKKEERQNNGRDDNHGEERNAREDDALDNFLCQLEIALKFVTGFARVPQC
jgi:hypothetical protein